MMQRKCIWVVLLSLASTNTVVARKAAVASAAAAAGDKSAVAAKISADPPKKWLEICNRLAPATSVLCSLAPLPTIFEVSRSKSVGGLPLLPYSSMAANGFIWALYGWLTDSPSVKWANVAGTLLGSYYFRQFRTYSKPGSSDLPGTINQHVLAVTWIVLLNMFVVAKLPKQRAAEIVGKEGVLVSI